MMCYTNPHLLYLLTRDVPDIRFRFRLAGYPAVFFYPVPAPVPAEMVPGTGYLYRIVLGRFRFEFDRLFLINSDFIA